MNDKIHSLCAFAQQHRITLEQAQELVAAGGPAIFDFDEALYLEENPDVARSLANGEFNSALHFYFLHGRYENRSGGPEGETPPEIKFKGPTHRGRCASACMGTPSFSRLSLAEQR